MAHTTPRGSGGIRRVVARGPDFEPAAHAGLSARMTHEEVMAVVVKFARYIWTLRRKPKVTLSQTKMESDIGGPLRGYFRRVQLGPARWMPFIPLGPALSCQQDICPC